MLLGLLQGVGLLPRRCLLLRRCLGARLRRLTRLFPLVAHELGTEHALGFVLVVCSTPQPDACHCRTAATRHGVELRYYDVIYHLTDWVKQAMAGELGPEIIETVVGRAEVREVFSAGKHGKAAGLLVTEGIIRKALKARITRDDVITYTGEIASLRRFKDDVAEVRAGLECGVTFTQNFTDLKPGDFLETFEVEERERTL